MPCKIEIKENLINKVENISKDGLGKPIEVAKQIEISTNKRFGEKVVEFVQITDDFVDRFIIISEELIDKYFNKELQIEQQESLDRQKEGNWKINEEGDIITFNSLSSKTEVEKILTEGNIELEKIVEFIPDEQVIEEKFKNPQIIKRMREIIDTLGLKTEFSELGENINAIADIGRRLIQFSKGDLTEDNFTEEVLHFVVDILENKNPKLYEILKDKVRSYPIYTEVLKEYSKEKNYQLENGRPDLDKIKKEAIAQLLVQKLLTDTPSKDDKGFLSAIWDTVSNWIKSLFQNYPQNLTDEFEQLANEILTNKEYVTKEDVNYLSSGSFASKKKNSLQKAKYKFGSQKSNIRSFSNPKEMFDYIKEIASTITKVTEQELNSETGELEDVEYYVTETGNKQRVTSVLKESSKWLYENIDKSDVAEAIREAKMQKGTDVHKTIEDIVDRFVDSTTGKLRAIPLDAPDNTVVDKKIYKILEEHIKDRLSSYLVDTLFLTETPVVDEESGVAGTVDFIAILPNMQVDILDWKTTNILYKKDGQTKKRFDISPFNQKYWREQLQLYKNALISYGISDFRNTRAIPIAVEINAKLIDKKIGWGVASNVMAQILSAKIGSVDTKKIKPEDFLLIPVATRFESTGSERVNDTIEKLWAIYDRISKTIYSESEKYKKKLEMDRLISAIRELQVKKEATQFKNLFNDSFIRFNKLAEENIDFLDGIDNNSKFLSNEDSDKINSELKDIYDAIEFLASFGDFSETIKELYPQYNSKNDPEGIIENALLIDANSKNIYKKLFSKAEKIIEKLAFIHGIEDFSAIDIENSDSKIEKFMSSISQRDEKSIQLASKMIKAMSFLSKKETEKFFNEETGEFAKVYDNIKKWIKSNKSSLSKVYGHLLAKEIIDFTYNSNNFKKEKEFYTKNNVEIKKSDYYLALKEAKNNKKLKINKEETTRRLISKLDASFFDVLKEKKLEFKEFYEQQYDELVKAGYKGNVLISKIADKYKAKILPFLSENYDLSEYDKKYAEALKIKKEQLDKLTLDEDVIIDEIKRNQYLQDWKEQYDIYSSPKALFEGNWLLSLKEGKWLSKEYEFLKKKENKPLLDAFELFEGLNLRAKKAGMLDNVPNYWKFLPSVEDKTLALIVKNRYQDFKSLPITGKALTISGTVVSAGALVFSPQIAVITAGSVGTFIVYKYFSQRFTDFIEKYFTPYKPFAEQIDLVTGRTYKNRKVKYKSVEDDSYLSNDLFYVFSQWADHIIKFETVSAYEQRLLMLQMLENKKEKTIAVDSESKIEYYTDSNGIKYKDKKNKKKKLPGIEEDLEKIIYHYIYNDDVETRPSFYQLGEYLYRSTMKAFVGFSPLAWLSNLAGAYAGAVIQQGNLYNENDLDSGLNSTFGFTNKELFGKNAQEKIKFLTSLVQSKIQSQYDVEYINKFKNNFDPTEVIFWGFRAGDHWLQDGLSTAILLNTTIVNGKFVNIGEFVRKKYESERFKGDAKQRKTIEKKIEKEIQELKTTKNLFHLLEKKGNSFDLKGFNATSLEGFTELQNLQGRIQSYVKNSIGGIDEFDKSIAQMTWYMKFITQFKNWLPKVYGSRIQKYRYDFERKEEVYGQYRILKDALFKDGIFLTTALNGIKALSPLLAYSNPITGLGGALINTGLITGSKYIKKNSIKYQVNVQEAAKNAYQKMKLERIQQGNPTKQTEAEFVDMYINGLINSLNSIRQVATIGAAICIIASLSSGAGDDEKKWLKLLGRLFFKTSKELEGDKDIDALMAILNNGIPVLGYLKEIKKLLSDIGLEAQGNVQFYLLGDDKGEEKMKKAHPYHRAINLTAMRNIHQMLLTLSDEYEDYSEVKSAPSQIDLTEEEN